MQIYYFIFGLIFGCYGAPVEEQLNSTEASEFLDNKRPNDTDVYDYRQHGKDNYRVSLKGLTILAAPADVLIGASMIMAMNMEQIQKLNSVLHAETGNKNETKTIDCKGLKDCGENLPPANAQRELKNPAEKLQKFWETMMKLQRKNLGQ